MARTVLDYVVLMDLLAARAETIDLEVVFLWAGEDLPDGAYEHLVKVGVAVKGVPDQQRSGPDAGSHHPPQMSRVQISFVCQCSPDRMEQSAWALAQLGTAVAAAFGDCFLEDADTTHRFDANPADIDFPLEADEQTGMSQCLVTVEGVWARRTGGTLRSVPPIP